MKNNSQIILIFIIVITLIACKNEVKKDTNHKGFTIHGTLLEDNSSVVYLFNNKNVRIDSSKVKNNNFYFKGLLTEPEIFSIQVKNRLKKHSIALENTIYNVFINDGFATVFGGKLNTKQVRFNTLKKELNAKKLAALNTFMIDGVHSDELYKSITKLKSKESKIISRYLIENSNNILSTNLLSSTKNLSLEELKKVNTKIDKQTLLKGLLVEKIAVMQKKLDAKMQLQKLAEEKRIEALKKTARKPAIMFSGDGLKGNMISLQEIIKGKKVILIDFWASWCGPCREVTPKVRKLYQKYKNKGFTILTVSEDTSEESWRKGIAEDNMLSWHHIFDDYGRISRMHNIRAIPHMILIDGNGGIIQEKISISELEYQLQELL